MKTKGSGFKGQGPERRVPRSGVRGQRPEISKSPNPQIPKSALGFTLIELLVTLAIIGILAGLALGVAGVARQAAAEAATKSTIAKLNNIIMRRYESYLTRRVPLGALTYASDDGAKKKGQRLWATDAAIDRLYALRDLMRMEMPDRQYDACADGGTNVTAPITLPKSKYKPDPKTVPAITRLYASRLANAKKGNGNSLADVSAELLYMIVSLGSPEAMSQFSPSEIGDVDANGLPEFLDGWGRPIGFLRWAPGFSNCPAMNYRGASTIQSGVAQDTTVDLDKDPGVARWTLVKDSLGNDKRRLFADHDAFDAYSIDAAAFHLIPLIYSAGPDGKFGLQKNVGSPAYYFSKDATTQNMFSDGEFTKIGEPTDKEGSFDDFRDNITNHHIEAR
jgi:prepilin-type N-terminal cleavage/methylation domain-containing protein